MKSPQEISEPSKKKRDMALKACAKAAEKRKKTTPGGTEGDAQPTKKLKAQTQGKPKPPLKGKSKGMEKKKRGTEVEKATVSKGKGKGRLSEREVEIEEVRSLSRKAKVSIRESELKEVEGSKSKEKGKGKEVEAAKPKAKGKVKEVEIEKIETPPKESSTVEEFYEKLHGMKFEQGIFLDELVLRKLGLFEDVARMFENMGIGKFMMMKEVAYKDLTCQFLSTLEARFYEEEHPKAASKGYGEIRFKINGMMHQLSFRELSEIFEFKNVEAHGETLFDYPMGELQRFWESIASESYEPGTCKYTSIRSPVLKYVHMTLTRTLFTRVEYNKVSKDEIVLLGLGVKPFLKTLKDGSEFIGTKHTPSLATFLVRHLLFYKDWALETKGKRSSLAIGWMVTPILRFKGIKLPEIEEKWRLIDGSHLARAQFYKGKVGSDFAYNLKLENATYAQVLLPNHSLTTLDNPENIFFTPTGSSLYNSSEKPPIEVYRGNKQRREERASRIQDEETHDEPSQHSAPTAIHGGRRYHFNPYEGVAPNASTSQAHNHIRLLQRWCKWQDRTMQKMARKYKKLENKVKTMGKKIKELTRSGEASSSSPRENKDSKWDMTRETHHGMELVVYQEGGPSMEQQGEKEKRKAWRSPSPCSSNPSLSLGSSTSSPSL